MKQTTFDELIFIFIMPRWSREACEQARMEEKSPVAGLKDPDN